MYQRNFFLLCPLFVISCLTACADSQLFSSNSTPSTVEIPEASAQTLDSIKQLVIESLVLQADDYGKLHSSAEKPDQINTSDTGSNTTPLPVIPAVAMTANGVVEREINDYLINRRRLLNIWINRGETYFPMVEEIFAEEGVPDELKYLALGESSLQSRAISSAGAAGMWQFMPATGRGMGLTVNNRIDERLDPEKATRAAAQHLKELYEVYHGNWHLALAGYNCSFRCISRAVRKAGGSIESPPSYWEIYPYLPRETRDFIPKFIAAALITSNPDQYGIRNPEQVSEQAKQKVEFHYDIVEINGMLALKDAATLAGVTLETLSELNPSLRQGVLPDNPSPYQLKIPFNSHSKFINAFNQFSTSEKMLTPSKYSVRSGDSLNKIARQFKVGVKELQMANNIHDSLIHPGQQLLIPGLGNTHISLANTERKFVQYSSARFRPIKLGDGFALVKQPEFSTEKPLMMVKLTSIANDFTTVMPTVYVVRNGDTLGEISKRFDVSIRDIQNWNNVRGTTIFLNQKLTLHSATSPPALSSYLVQSGDNLGTIARRFGVSVANLKRWNRLSNNLIFPGQSLELN